MKTFAPPPAKKNLIFLVLLIIMITNFPVFSQGYPPDGVVKIMPVGNSITQGTTGEDRAPYRRYLWHLLQDNGYLDVDFIGSLQNVYASSGPGFFTDYDPHHEGHWGWRADQILCGNANPPNNTGSGTLSDWLQNHVPDAVLLHLGTNEMIQYNPDNHGTLEVYFNATIQDIRDIIGLLHNSNPDVFIFLAQLIPTKNAGINSLITQFNVRLASLAAEYDSPCSGVILVDQYSGFVPADDLSDTYHPNAIGARKMADKWYEKLKLYLDGNLPGYQQITPVFAQIGPLCQNSPAPALPLTSENGVSGTWSPAVIDTSEDGDHLFTFTPDGDQCAVVAYMIITIEEETPPVFSRIDPLCQNIIAPILPTESVNKISGTWSPSAIDTSVTGVTTYTFSPDAGQCAVVAYLSVTIEEAITPVFAQIGPLCQNSTAPALPLVSDNGVSGKWSPATIDSSITGDFDFTFTPDGDCGLQVQMIISIDEEMIPVFTQIGPLYQDNTAPVLPLVSENGILGSWAPAVIDTSSEGIFAFEFIADVDQCAVGVAMEIVILPIYSLFLEVNPEGAGTVSGEGLYTQGTEVNLSATANQGYLFVNWTQNGVEISDQASFNYPMPAQDVTLTANFEAIIPGYLLSLEVNPEGAGTVSGGGLYTHGAEVGLSATANPGYWFVNWTLNGVEISDQASFNYTMPAQDVTLTANFEAIIPEYLLSLEVNPEGAGIVSGEGLYIHGAEVNLSATANPGFEFSNWSLDGSEISDQAIFNYAMPAQDVTLTANFKAIPPIYTLTLEVNPPGAGFVSGGGEYQQGAEVNISASANPGFVFVNWTLNGEVVSQHESFNFLMPAGDVKLIAWLSSENLTGTCANSPSHWFAKSEVVWPFDLFIGRRRFTQEEGKNFWPANTVAKRALTQYAAISLSQVDLSLFPGLLPVMQVIDHYYENIYPNNPGPQVSDAAGYIKAWIGDNHCDDDQLMVTIFPNPFREKLTIQFTAASDSRVVLEVFDMGGKVIETLFDGPVLAGQPYKAEYVPRLKNTGMVFYRLIMDNQVRTGKVLYHR